MTDRNPRNETRPRSHSEAVAPRKRGFNLIEAAIVLGIVGLVIGGIWVAAAKISQKQRVSQTLEGIFSIAEQLNRQFGKSPVASPCVGSCSVSLTPTQMQAMISPPAGWSFTADGSLDSPIWKNVLVEIDSVIATSSGNYILLLPLDGMSSESDCKALGVELLKSLHRGNVEMAESYSDSAGGGGFIAYPSRTYRWWSYTGVGSGFINPLIGAAEGCNFQDIAISRQ